MKQGLVDTMEKGDATTKHTAIDEKCQFYGSEFPGTLR